MNSTARGAGREAWLAAGAVASLAHAGVWLAYTGWHPVQSMPQLPPVQISLVSAPAPQETQPAPPRPPRHTSPPRPQPPAVATKTETPLLPDAADPVPVEPAVTSETEVNTSPEAEEQTTTQPVYQAAYLNNPPPSYPLAARRRGIEGTVVVRAHIMEDGNCHQVNLSKSSGYAMLDQAALAAVKSWRFVPAQRGSQSISAWVIVPITFRLDRQNEQTQTL